MKKAIEAAIVAVALTVLMLATRRIWLAIALFLPFELWVLPRLRKHF